MQVERAGIRGLSTAQHYSDTGAPDMDDPRYTRRQLQADLASPAAQQTFLDSLGEVMASDEQLRRCLLPISVTVSVSKAGAGGLHFLLPQASHDLRDVHGCKEHGCKEHAAAV